MPGNIMPLPATLSLRVRNLDLVMKCCTDLSATRATPSVSWNGRIGEQVVGKSEPGPLISPQAPDLLLNAES